MLNRKRILSAALACAVLFSGLGCGETAGTQEKADVAQEPGNGQEAGIVAGDGEAEGIAEGEGTEHGEAGITALAWMREVNQGEPLSSEDNYRTWYEVFVYSFYDSDGDGIGDLKGLIEKLDYIGNNDPGTDTDLGCDGIWLMPVMPSPSYHKYDVTDYCDIDPQYGTLQDFEKLVEESHARNINVIIDLVMNHSSSRHPWFTAAADYLSGLTEGESPDAAECPYVDYYHFSREKGNGYSPLSDTGWYYEAQFSPDMPDLNLSNEAVRGEFEKIVDFWLERSVDGFRLDAAKEYYSGSMEENISVLDWFDTMVKEKKEDAYIVAEVWNDLPTYANYYESGIDSCFNFAFADSTGIIANVLKGTKETGAKAYGTALTALQETLETYSDSYIDAPFYTNHDMARGAGYYSGEDSERQTKMAQAMNLLMSGSAFLYYGEELGMKGSGKDENKRAPMYWTEDAAEEGMCSGPPAMDTVKMKYGSLKEQQADGNSVYAFVREVIRLRNSHPEISHGKVQFEEALSGEKLCVIRKTYRDAEVVLAFNLSGEECELELSDVQVNQESADEENIKGLLLTGNENISVEGSLLKLPAYSVVILK